MLKPLLLSSGPSRLRRGIIDLVEAEWIARLFSVLASTTRVRILHAIAHHHDPCMTDLAKIVGMKPQAVSNQLRKLVDMGIILSTRRGSHIHYRLEHAGLKALLLHGLELSRRIERKSTNGLFSMT